MTATQSPTTRCCAVLLAAAAALGASTLARAAEPPPPTTVSTAQPPAPAPTPAGKVRVDAYRGLGRHAPAAEGSPPAGARPDPEPVPAQNPSGHSNMPLRIGVAVDLVSCADGNLEARAIDAGGWHHDIADACAHSSTPTRGSVTLHAAPAAPAAAPARKPAILGAPPSP